MEALHGGGVVRGWWSRRLGFARGCFVFDPLEEEAARGGSDQALRSDPGSGFTDLRRPVYRGVELSGGWWVCLGVSANRLLLLGIRRVTELFACSSSCLAVDASVCWVFRWWRVEACDVADRNCRLWQLVQCHGFPFFWS